MASGLISFFAMLVATLLLDHSVRPRPRRFRLWQGVALHALAMAGVFGAFLAVTGHALVAAVLALALTGIFTTVSNAKHAMLGEPLLFSDLALILAIFRHPRFYLTALTTAQRWLVAMGGLAMVAALALLFRPVLMPHIVGIVLVAGSWAGLRLVLPAGSFRHLARRPDADADVERLGLIATLWLYWRRWKTSSDPLPAEAFHPPHGDPHHCPDLVVIVQCESFADPAELAGGMDIRLEGLEAARAQAWQWGDLEVSGFGAYTMRTEYGVLFGRSEEELGFRRYDPFLTAHGETSYALSARLRACHYRSLFVHPHDMRFYGRDRLMPAIGFHKLIGEDSFAPANQREGRYVDDRTLGASIANLIDEAREPTLIYSVTMENHGPWDKDQLTGSTGGMEAYLRHLRSSDAMLLDLMEHMAGSGRSGLLVFFGDHRPSIPGVTQPGGPRHTPYVMLRFASNGRILTRSDSRENLTPDRLHHAILRCIAGDEVAAARPAEAGLPSPATT